MKLSKLITLIILAIVLSACSSSSHNNAAIDKIFSQWHPDDPSCNVSVTSTKHQNFKKAYGMANLEHGIKNNAHNSVFRMASVSKQFTAAAILMLSDDTTNTFSINDPLSDYANDLGITMIGRVPYADEITIKDLVHHTSGLRDYILLVALTNKDFNITKKDAIRLINKQNQLNFRPGQKTD
ncbi:MAG: CubicO group peptidase (beta-lactamase class C family) [Phenylobacterium sp.]|jgi:CubicO group peptidase (beta-lactamase class C family)